MNISEILSDHATDHVSVGGEVYFVSTSLAAVGIKILLAGVKISVARFGNPVLAVFVLLDTCVGIGASDAPHFFHGNATACNYGITGAKVKEAAEAPMSIGTSQPGAFLFRDVTGGDFIVRCGGPLRADEGDLNETIFSVSQTLYARVKSNGKQGGFMGGKSFLVHFPGHTAAVSVKDGLFGVPGRFTLKDDPLLQTLDVVWASEDALYYPPKDLISSGEKLCMLDRQNFKVCAHSTMDNGDAAAITKGVKSDLDPENVDLMLRKFTCFGPMGLETEELRRIWIAKWGGLSPAVQERAMDLNPSGAEMLTAQGKKDLKKMIHEPFQNPGSSFPRHKRSARIPEKGKLVTHAKVAGDVLCADESPIGRVPSIGAFFSKRPYR
jgi:hypothetical protein